MQPMRKTLSENIRAQSVELLNKHLAAAIDLRTEVEQAHWNVRGPSVIAIDELFDKVAVEGENHSDRTAVRAAGLGATAHRTIQVSAERSFLVPYTLGVTDKHQHAFAVSGTLAAFGQSARQGIRQATTCGDTNTADVFPEVSSGIDQQLWLVECHMAPTRKQQGPHPQPPPRNPSDRVEMTSVTTHVSERASLLSEKFRAASELNDRNKT